MEGLKAAKTEQQDAVQEAHAPTSAGQPPLATFSTLKTGITIVFAVNCSGGFYFSRFFNLLV